MYKTILSWDVGIKHLAYCVIKYNISDKTFKIEEWKIIDLTGSDNNVNKCCGVLKKKKKSDTIDVQCDANAKFYGTIDDKNYYYCQTHKSQYNCTLNEVEAKYVSECNDVNNICVYITPKSKKECGKKANYTFNEKDNITYCCKVHKEMYIKNKFKEISIKPIKSKNSKSFDPQSLCENMYTKLKEIEIFKTVDEVYIENQPTLINPVMKSVASMLFSYFVFMFKENKLSDKIVKFVSPSTKINITSDLILFVKSKINEHIQSRKVKCGCRLCKLENDLLQNEKEYGEDCEKYTKYKFAYDSLKELGVLYTELTLMDTDNFKLITNYAKKDDLCDAFLHGFKKI